MQDGNGTNGHSASTNALKSELAARLHALGRRVSPVEICDLWVFPPLPDIEESGDFVLFTRVLADEMRRVCAVEFTDPPVPSNGNLTSRQPTNGNGSAGNGSAGNGSAGNGTARNGDTGHDPAIPPMTLPTVRITEYGRVPVGRVQRVVDGFRRRLGDHREPFHVRVDGCPESWVQMLAGESSSS